MRKLFACLAVLVIGLVFGFVPATHQASAHQASGYQAAALVSSEAARSASSNINGPFNVCNYRAEALCFVSNGVGSQVTVGSSGYATLTFIRVGGTTNDPEYEMENANGHCLYENGSNQMMVENNGCSGNSYEKWFFEATTSNGIQIGNADYELDAYITGLHSGNKVWMGGLCCGDYGAWEYCNQSSCIFGPNK